MTRWVVVLAVGFALSACSDENMDKWKEMNKDRIQETPKDDSNLPTVKGDVEEVKKTLRNINDAVHDKVESMLEKKNEQ